MQDAVIAWLPVLLTLALQGAFLLVVLVASVECMRSAWRQRRQQRHPDQRAGRPLVGLAESKESSVEATVQAAEALRQELRELAAEEDTKRRARELREASEAESTVQREAELSERLKQVRVSQQEKQKAEAERKAQQARLKKLEELRVREEEVLQQKAARLSVPGRPDHPGQELEEAKEVERDLRHQQDTAFQASLAADRAREAELRKIAAERERIETGAAAQAERKRQEKAAWEERKRRLRDSLPAEPPVGTAGRIALSVRLPNNDTFRRTWSPDSSLSEVYNWVDSLDALTVHPGDYRLVTTFPRTVLEKERSNSEGALLLRELDMYPSAALVVEIK